MKIFSIIVTFNPKIKQLRESLEILRYQCEKLIIIDNGSEDSFDKHLKDFETIEVITLGKNYGIAYALNKGIDCAVQQNATHCLLMDQDSIPAEDMVQLLAENYNSLSQNETIAAIGPKIVLNKDKGTVIGFKRFYGPFRRTIRTSNNPSVKADYLLTSGTFLSIETFKAVGKFEEDLFIDFIDVEWGLRAKRKGLHCYGIAPAELYHTLGISSSGQYHGHAPFRYYYICRNPLLLLRGTSLSFWEKLFFLSLTLLRPYILFFQKIPSKKESLYYMLKGMIDGVKNKKGCVCKPSSQ